MNDGNGEGAVDTVGPQGSSENGEATANLSTLARTPTQFLEHQRESSAVIKNGRPRSLPPSPTDMLLVRYAGWLSFLRLLIVQFDEQSSLERTLAQGHARAVKSWTSHPLKEIESAFDAHASRNASDSASAENTTPTSSIHDLTKHIRDANSQLASNHDALYQVLANQTLPALRSLEKDVHQRMSAMLSEEKERRRQRDKDERKLKSLIEKLQTALDAAQGTGDVPAPYAKDPWLINIGIKRHLSESHSRDIGHLSTLEGIEETFGTWEKNLIHSLKWALLAYTSLHPSSSGSSSTGEHASPSSISGLHTAVSNIDAEKEWQAYRTAHLVPIMRDSDENQTRKDDYPGATDPFVAMVKEGPMLRKSKIRKQWHAHWYCLTAAGWLHQFDERPKLDNITASAASLTTHQPSVKNSVQPPPVMSWWLKEYVMADQAATEFHLTHTKPRALGLRRKPRTYQFSTNSLSDSTSWATAIAPFVAMRSQPNSHRTSVAGFPLRPAPLAPDAPASVTGAPVQFPEQPAHQSISRLASRSSVASTASAKSLTNAESETPPRHASVHRHELPSIPAESNNRENGTESTPPPILSMSPVARKSMDVEKHRQQQQRLYDLPTPPLEAPGVSPAADQDVYAHDGHPQVNHYDDPVAA
ncbi:uncharacterized protein EV422DRAFT_620106 [Fimicolochytrium jonesii]|uniref:uncharacterized protein n=1 Tax=Fimicolochytrium jonesii TaxID=1396493 RepID=UPI0022FE0B7E|nr:uncharacterized protein EV422DRAFT_620106 [Fimicolochytrium jonesii]KAI8820673.1 hypothetical protein EV422DRAFT_620106 [Fimicolochytrium jonesii]